MSEPVIVPVWVVDDEPRNLRQIERTFDSLALEGVEVVTFLDARLALAEYGVLVAANDPAHPRIVFMDYFLGGIYGNEVTHQILTLHAAAVANGCTLPRPIIVGHSSTRNGSLAILEAGGDFMMPKEPGASVSMAVLREFATDKDLERVLSMRATA